ncbi:MULTISPECIES: hypothetical protein [Clostridium]|uniref:PTS sugar transporter subunit IIB n=1 Tax=Clostridium TaxID=1485 RepID=UPI0027DAEFC2|nr:hypothetical protein [Clostridium neonatale]
MNNEKILLVCLAAICTSFLVTKIKEVADQKEIEIGIDVLPVAECSSVIDSVDIVFLGPQVRF